MSANLVAFALKGYSNSRGRLITFEFLYGRLSHALRQGSCDSTTHRSKVFGNLTPQSGSDQRSQNTQNDVISAMFGSDDEEDEVNQDSPKGKLFPDYFPSPLPRLHPFLLPVFPNPHYPQLNRLGPTIQTLNLRYT